MLVSSKIWGMTCATHVLALDRPGSVTKQTAMSYLLWGMCLKVLIMPSSSNVLECLPCSLVHGQQLRFSARQANIHTLHALTSLRSIRDHLLDAEMQSAADVNHFSHNTV